MSDSDGSQGVISIDDDVEITEQDELIQESGGEPNETEPSAADEAKKDEVVIEDVPIETAEQIDLSNEGDITVTTIVGGKPTDIDVVYYEPKDSNPKVEVVKDVEVDDDDIFEDETIAERIIALSEMFPEKVRNVSWTLATTSWSCLKATYGLSCNILWIVSTSAIILAAPPLIAHEREQIEEMNRQQQRQILLGPSASLSGAPGLTPTMPTRL